MKEVTPCKGCGKPIFWGETKEGGKIPLDPRPIVYILRGPFENSVARIENAMVSHFATCPNANNFSGSKKRPDSQALKGENKCPSWFISTLALAISMLTCWFTLTEVRFCKNKTLTHNAEIPINEDRDFDFIAYLDELTGKK